MTDFMRGRRLRGSAALRDLVREQTVRADDLVYPIFVSETATDFEPIGSMPGVSRVPEAKLAALMRELRAEGLKAVMLFGVLAENRKDAVGSDSLNDKGLLARMVKIAKQAAPEMVVMADICFCEYTDHGHCGVVHDHGVDNDATLENLAKQAVVAARAGADVLAPSAMMDGQVAAIRAALDASGFSHLPILAYSSKFASALYGPFREAAGCGLKGDRKTYQMDPFNGREALRESLADEAQGADMLMVKPGVAYLDILAQLRERTLLPLVVYQVSGEYAMVKFAAQAGALDEKRVMRELLGAFKRAGADLIITYFAREALREIAAGTFKP
ncbi:MAG: porphobilinogen synthase [Proteobacteria bacterium]|nr:porphobilinogen synthase [Pseudomonadota bacterium]